jgi:4-amino-4-deoxy-L-arabinose transferase-like glycosyltransferase
MTRDPVAGRGVGMIEAIRRLDAGTLLTTILVLGLVLRVFIAGVYLPMSGFAIDIGDFSAWGQRMASVGPGDFYEEGYFSDYPPGYLYVLWLLGGLGGLLAPIVGQDATAGLVKIPGILADIGVAWLLFATCRRWGHQLIASTRIAGRPETLGLIAAAVYLFNPGTIFNSAVWGQVDSVGTLVLLATIYALARGWTEVAAVGAVVALLVKFQFAFLVPVVAIVGIRRHLLGRSSDPAHDARRDPVRVITSLAAGFASLTLLMLPFGMLLYAPRQGGEPGALLGILPEADPTSSLIGKFIEAAGTYTGLTVNAFNLWRNPWSGLGDTLHWGDDTVTALAVGGLAVTWQQVGTLLFAAAALLALVQVARRDDLRGVLIASLVLAVAFFVLPTRVHERYLFPALALAAPLLLSSRVWPWVYAGLSVNFFFNVYWVYTEDWSFTGRIITPGAHGEPMPQDPFLAATLLTDTGIWLLSAMIVAVFGVVAWRSLRLALRPDAEAAVPSAPRGAVVSAVMREPHPHRDAQPSRAGRRRFGWLAPNPADAYLREPSRRLDRRDAAILLALVLFALVFRLWRLDVPRGMHFDEVYHARSATEFLSSWRHGWDRDVYEWTHPMLAKYLIAGGIVLADPNQVVGTDALESPSGALAVAPRRGSLGYDRSLAFTQRGSTTIVASDATTGDELARWDASGPIATLAYDPHALRLLVGRADGGVVETYELAGMLASPDGRGPPAGPTIDSGLETVSEVLVGDGSDLPILLRGADGIAVLEPVTDAVRAVATGTYGGIGLVRGTGDTEDRVVVTDAQRGAIVYLDAATLQPDGETGEVGVDAALVGPLIVRGSGSDQQVFALTGPLAAGDGHEGTPGGVAALDADQGSLTGLVPLPGTASLIGEQRIAGLVYVAGQAEDGVPATWVVEPHVERRGSGTIGLAVFDATELPGLPLAMAFDVAGSAPADDNGRLLLTTASDEGEAALVRIDAGSNAFAWRLAGALFGALLVALIYLLAATMFSRRRIAVLAAVFVALDGMSYAMSRIAMNDIFVAVFIVAAFLLFWQVWSGRWSRSAWWVLPLVGVVIGLAAATKWVGFYGLAGLWVLVLARSDLGRLVLVALVAMAAVVGGIGAPWPFLLTMLGIGAVALAITWARPIRIDRREALLAIPATTAVLAGVALAFVVAFGVVSGPEPDGAVELLFAVLARGAEAAWPAWIMLGMAGALIVARAWQSLRHPASDARWYRPGELGGFSWSWIGACLLVIPLTVYALSYLPYLALGHGFAAEGGPGYGWSLEQLHRQMFGYHFNLTAGHASASPWWSWPLALKPTWFYNGSFDGGQVAVIYNGGNPILFWAGIPALVAAAILAWKRRSAALVFVVAAFAVLYVPWIRIERATFAYHYLTAVVFAMIAVAYVVDELLRRPAWRELGVGYLSLAAVVGLLVFPLGAALPMPDWYVNAARALPPWNYAFQFPDPPSGDRAELVSASGVLLVAGSLVAAAASAFALWGRAAWDAWSSGRRGPVPEEG